VLELAEEVKRAMKSPHSKVKHLAKRREVEHASSHHMKSKCMFGLGEATDLRTGLQVMADWVKAKGSGFDPVQFSSVEVLENLPPSWHNPQILANFEKRYDKVPHPKLKYGQKGPRIMYFAVAYQPEGEEGVNHRVDGALNTWTKKVPVLWYSNKYDKRLKNIVIKDPNGDSQELYLRVKDIWKHVWQNFPDYDWYFRLWDDNYVIVENVPAALEGLNPKDPWLVGLSFGKFPAGGAGWIVSKGAMKKWMPKIDTCDELTKRQPPLCDRKLWCEDVLFGNCMADMGVKVKNRPGMFFANTHEWRGADYPDDQRAELEPSKLRCAAGRKTGFRPIVFHYMKEGISERLEKLLYDGDHSDCGNL